MVSIPSERVFCDTSYFFAALCEKDIHHKDARDIAEHIKDQKIISLATWDIISETLTLLRYRNTYRSAIFFLEEVLPSLEIIRYDQSVRDEAARVFRTFNRDRRISYCDAISYVLSIAELRR